MYSRQQQINYDILFSQSKIKIIPPIDLGKSLPQSFSSMSNEGKDGSQGKRSVL